MHTLNGTAVTDRWALAILENFQGEVPDVLKQYGAPGTINPRLTPSDTVLQGCPAARMAVRRGAGAVERGGLENCWACKVP